MESESYVKLYRKTLQNEWWDDPNTMRLWFFLLMSVNWKDKEWHGMVIKKGQLMTSISKLSKNTSLTQQSIRTSIRRLKSTHQLTSESTNGGTLITVCKWEQYQGEGENNNEQTNKLSNKRLTSRQQTPNKRLTTTKEVLEVLEDKEDEENTNTVSPIIPLKSADDLFEAFWSVYPKKVNRKGCEVAYKRITHLAEEQATIISDVLKQKQSRQWLESNGQYIPNPLTYIHQERWKSTREQTPAEKFESAGISEEWFK